MANRKKLYFTFVVKKKKFDRVPSEIVWWALKARVGEWLAKEVMVMYSEARTAVKTEAGDSGSFGVDVGVHQGSVLSPLLFNIVMDVVTLEVRAGFPLGVLYADDLVLMTPPMKELRRELKEHRMCLVGKGLKVNAMTSYVQVGKHKLAKVYDMQKVCPQEDMRQPA